MRAERFAFGAPKKPANKIQQDLFTKGLHRHKEANEKLLVNLSKEDHL